MFIRILKNFNTYSKINNLLPLFYKQTLHYTKLHKQIVKYLSTSGTKCTVSGLKKIGTYGIID